jgi:hypothetical protein
LVSNDYLNTTAPWMETGLTWDNAPGITDTALSSTGAASLGQWMEFEVTPAIVGNGIYSFGLKSDDADAVYYRSKENDASTWPQLVVEFTPTPGGVAKRGDSNAPEENAETVIPSEFVLHQNYPNPFNPATTIRFGLPEDAYVTLKVYSLTGQEVMALVDDFYPAGTHSTLFNARHLPSGTYFYEMKAGEVRKVRQLMLLK